MTTQQPDPAPSNSSASPPSSPATEAPPLDHFVQNYGDLLFDFCESVLWSSATAQMAFRTIMKDIEKSKARNAFQEFERAWVLKVACERLRSLVRRYGRKLNPSEQIMLDAAKGGPDDAGGRIKQFDSYFHRLSTEEQMILLLRDKYGIPYPELSAALTTPEGSIKIRRQQALRALEAWLWERR